MPSLAAVPTLTVAPSSIGFVRESAPPDEKYASRRSVLKECVAHDNHGRPHASFGPGIPDVTFKKEEA
jgi:hypothetical protein